MTEASGNATHPEQRSNPAPRTTRPAVGVARPQPLPNAYPAFRIPAQEGYATSYDAAAALEEEHSHLNMKNVIGPDGSSVLFPKNEYTYLTLDALTSCSEFDKARLQNTAHQGYRHGQMPLAQIKRLSQVKEVMRCVIPRLKEETRQTIVTVRGTLPLHLDLDNWGVYFT